GLAVRLIRLDDAWYDQHCIGAADQGSLDRLLDIGNALYPDALIPAGERVRPMSARHNAVQLDAKAPGDVRQAPARVEILICVDLNAIVPGGLCQVQLRIVRQITRQTADTDPLLHRSTPSCVLRNQCWATRGEPEPTPLAPPATPPFIGSQGKQ